jgi:hypothetical protein
MCNRQSADAFAEPDNGFPGRRCFTVTWAGTTLGASQQGETWQQPFATKSITGSGAGQINVVATTVACQRNRQSVAYFWPRRHFVGRSVECVAMFVRARALADHVVTLIGC